MEETCASPFTAGHVPIAIKHRVYVILATMNREQEPITHDPEAQAQWEAVILAFHQDVVRKAASAQAQLNDELRRQIFAAVAQGRRKARS